MQPIALKYDSQPEGLNFNNHGCQPMDLRRNDPFRAEGLLTHTFPWACLRQAG
jgi:hypothetical protein